MQTISYHGKSEQNPQAAKKPRAVTTGTREIHISYIHSQFHICGVSLKLQPGCLGCPCNSVSRYSHGMARVPPKSERWPTHQPRHLPSCPRSQYWACTWYMSHDRKNMFSGLGLGQYVVRTLFFTAILFASYDTVISDSNIYFCWGRCTLEVFARLDVCCCLVAF